jgi:hypothetical protein
MMKIKFVAGAEDIEKNIDFPKLSKSLIPNWYKDIPSSKNFDNVKKCVPFLDAMMYGYTQTTWTDINVQNTNEGTNVFFNHEIPIFYHREKSDMPIQNEFYNIEFIWQRPWSVMLPEGYSALVTHPINRIDLPFFTLSAVVDFDKYCHMEIGNIPFYIKKDFEGIIPKGTPMFQILPIKRENWESEIQKYDEEFWLIKNEEKNNIDNFYKKKIWQRKLFN